MDRETHHLHTNIALLRKLQPIPRLLQSSRLEPSAHILRRSSHDNRRRQLRHTPPRLCMERPANVRQPRLGTGGRHGRSDENQGRLHLRLPHRRRNARPLRPIHILPHRHYRSLRHPSMVHSKLLPRQLYRTGTLHRPALLELVGQPILLLRR